VGGNLRKRVTRDRPKVIHAVANASEKAVAEAVAEAVTKVVTLAADGRHINEGTLCNWSRPNEIIS
jgi:hypothetical protein